MSEVPLYALWFRVSGSGCRVWASGFRVGGLGFRGGELVLRFDWSSGFSAINRRCLVFRVL